MISRPAIGTEEEKQGRGRIILVVFHFRLRDKFHRIGVIMETVLRNELTFSGVFHLFLDSLRKMYVSILV